MIRVLIQHDPDGIPVDLGMLEIVPLSISDDGEKGTYAVRVATDRAGAVGLHNLVIPDFPRTRLNSLGLLHEALKWIALTRPDILELEDGTSSSDLARRQSRVVPALQRWTSKLHRH